MANLAKHTLLWLTWPNAPLLEVYLAKCTLLEVYLAKTTNLGVYLAKTTNLGVYQARNTSKLGITGQKYL